MEIWKEIPNQAPNYQVSNLGNVRSLDYNRTGITRNMAIQPTPTGHNCVRIGNKAYSVAQFVLLAFVGGHPPTRHYAYHKDGDTGNDLVENLEWRLTSEQNRVNGKNGFKFKEGHSFGRETQFKAGVNNEAGVATQFKKGNTIGKKTRFKKKKSEKLSKKKMKESASN